MIPQRLSSGGLSQARRLLLVCPNQLGDFVMALPTVCGLSSVFAGNLTLAVKVANRELLKLLPGNPPVQVYSNELGLDSLFGGDSSPDCGNNVDAVLLLGRHCKIQVQLQQMGLKSSRIAKFDEFEARSTGEIHLARRFHRFVEQQLAVDLPSLEDSVRKIGACLKGLKAPLPGPYIVLHPGNSSALRSKSLWRRSKVRHRSWPANHWSELLKLVRGLWSNKIILTGTKGEARLASSLIAMVPRSDRSRMINLAGKTSSLDLAKVLSQARLFVGVDTGPTHLAGLVGTPTVALFGPTDPCLVGPIETSGKLRIIRTAIECSPCSKATRKKCRANQCMLGMIPPLVSSVVAGLLSSDKFIDRQSQDLLGQGFRNQTAAE